MNKVKIGSIYGKNIYTGNPQQLVNGEYFISVEERRPTGLYIKKDGKLVPLCNCEKETVVETVVEEKGLNLQDINILSNYHGKKENITPSEGYDGIAKVTYKKPKLEEKDTVTITKNGITEIKVGKGYDGLDDVTVIVNVENE